MSFEDALKVPLIGEEHVHAENANWQYLADFHPPLYKKNSVVKKALLCAFFVAPWALLVLLGAWNWNQFQQCKTRYYIRPDLTYSPVQDLVEYELKTFTTGFPEDPESSKYVGEPSPEVDELWKGLYPSLIQLVPKEKAAKLTNKTVIFPHDEQRRYAVEVDVFHQLHCLNMIRKVTRPDYYTPVIPEDKTEDPLLGPRHTSHCIETIRQALMCASDISVYTWEWDEKIQSHRNQVKNPHTCRNFEKLRNWAKVNTKEIYFDGGYRVMNDPLDPSTWIDGYTGD